MGAHRQSAGKPAEHRNSLSRLPNNNKRRYWNIAGSKTNAARALQDSSFNYMAIQEPSVNKQGHPYCPRGCRYQVVWTSGRAALYINKKIAAETLERSNGEDWARVTIGSGNQAVSLWSICSPDQEGAFWRSPIKEVGAGVAPAGRHLLVGDFNLHHPLWDMEGRTSRGANEFLELTTRWDLTIATPQGEITRTRKGQRDSTINLAWASSNLAVTYWGDLGWQGSDHRALRITIDIVALPHGYYWAAEGWNWTELDVNRAEAEAMATITEDHVPRTPTRHSSDTTATR